MKFSTLQYVQASDSLNLQLAQGTYVMLHVNILKLTFLTNFFFSRSTMRASSIVSMVSICLMHDGLMPMMYGRGEQTKSMRLLGRTGMNTCYRGRRERERERERDLKLYIRSLDLYMYKNCVEFQITIA